MTSMCSVLIVAVASIGSDDFGSCVRTRGHGTTPLRVKEDIEDVSSELGNRVKGCTSWMKRPELYCSQRVRI
ncbi:hypothetical protein TNCV_285381 [Trichonephila clavipes]|nr:hypothetical protein TNCV_285381 [Trichonephila clavipes]